MRSKETLEHIARQRTGETYDPQAEAARLQAEAEAIRAEIWRQFRTRPLWPWQSRIKESKERLAEVIKELNAFLFLC